MVMLLDLSGHDARWAPGGQEALDLTLSFCPVVVFLDIGLPGMNGHKVGRRLAEPATASAKLVALTGWSIEDDILESTMAGFHAHLTQAGRPGGGRPLAGYTFTAEAVRLTSPPSASCCAAQASEDPGFQSPDSLNE